MKKLKLILYIFLVIVFTMLAFYAITLKSENKILYQAARNWQKIILFQQDSINNLHKAYEYKIDSLENILKTDSIDL